MVLLYVLIISSTTGWIH